MGTIVLLFVVGLVGSALFDHFNLPGGAMVILPFLGALTSRA